MGKNQTNMNYGKLVGKDFKKEKNIVYYRRGMDELSLNITNACPNSCVFCIRDHNVGWGVSNLYLDCDPSNEEIVFEATTRINDLKSPVTKIKICGYGEPILRIADIPEIIKGIESKVSIPTWQITTSGWPINLIDDSYKHLSNAKKEGLTNIYLSMHATDVKRYAKIVRPSINPKVAFNQTIDFAKKCRNLGLDVTMAFLDKTKIDLNLVKEFAKKIDCKYEIREYE